MQTNSTNTFEMPNGVTVITDFEPMDFVMNPETEDLIRGDKLREGMIVLLEGCHMRQDPKNFETTDSAYTRQRCLETARWCTVTDIRTSRNNRDVLSFIGLYADGTKFERMYNESYSWFVKLDSMPKETIVEGIFTDGLNGITLDNAREMGIIRPIPSHDVMVPDVEGLFVDGFNELTLDRARELGYIRPIPPRVFAKPLGPLVIFEDQQAEEDRIAAEAIQEAEDYDRLHGDGNDIDEMDESFPHPSDTDVYKD